MNVKNHLLFYIVTPFLLFAVFASFYRFVVADDYFVEYEGECDPEANSCFIGTDETSGEDYFYNKMYKYAVDLNSQCGPDITDCAEASICLESDKDCLATYCSPDTIDDGEECADVSTTLQEPSVSELEDANDANLDTETEDASSTEPNSTAP